MHGKPIRISPFHILHPERSDHLGTSWRELPSQIPGKVCIHIDYGFPFSIQPPSEISLYFPSFILEQPLRITLAYNGSLV